MNLTFSPFPKLETGRLILRELRMSDAPEVLVLRSHPEAVRYTPIKIARDEKDARDYIQMIHEGIARNESILWAITLKGSEKMIGSICLWNINWEHREGDIGYVLHPDYHRQGIMSEALEAVVNFGFEQMNLILILAELEDGNVSSIGLLEKYHFLPDPDFSEEDMLRYRRRHPDK